MESTYFFKSNFLIPPSFLIATFFLNSSRIHLCNLHYQLQITYSQFGVFPLRSPQMMIQQQKRIHLESVLG